MLYVNRAGLAVNRILGETKFWRSPLSPLLLILEGFEIKEAKFRTHNVY
jgi:hypothetical protein